MKIIETLKHTSASHIPNPPQPEFTFQVGWASSYEELFNGSFESKGDINTLLSAAMSQGRVLLCGRGGAAKSVVMDRIARHAIEAGYLPIKVDLKTWTSRDIERWEGNSSESSDRLSQILQTANVGLTLPLLSALPPNLVKLLLIDGLNELRSTIGEQMIQVVDLAVTEQPGIRVILADRLVRRELRAPYRWKLATLLPLDQTDVSKYVSDSPNLSRSYQEASAEEKRLWASPFFLDTFLKKQSVGKNGSAAFNAFFSKIAFSDAELDVLAKAAYTVYRLQSSRTFKTEDLEIPLALAKKAEEAGVLVTKDGKSYFSHHLAHDYLAARFMNSHPREWNHRGFDALSFSGSSFDALAMVLEQINTVLGAEQFVRDLFDWNPYAAAYCLAEQRDTRISVEMQTVVLAMMAERKFSIFDATARRASDALLVIPTELAKRFAAAKTLEDVFLLVNTMTSEQLWFRDWAEIFTLTRSERLAAKRLMQLKSPDSVIGWTAANVLKRTKVGSKALAFIKSLAKSRHAVVRWRAVHVLGSFPSSENANIASRILDGDADHWVRYGAIRSLVEMAALGNYQIRKSVLSGIKARVGKIRMDKRILNELQSVLLISNINRKSEWIRLVSHVLEEIYNGDPATDAREQFGRLATKFRETYA